MARKRKSDATPLDEVDRTLYSTFCSAANSLSQLYTQAMNQQKVAFQAGERQALAVPLEGELWKNPKDKSHPPSFRNSQPCTPVPPFDRLAPFSHSSPANTSAVGVLPKLRRPVPSRLPHGVSTSGHFLPIEDDGSAPSESIRKKFLSRMNKD
ncbi:hypothetical protein KSP40_PGU001437 [Platanthera guangdongensis]|uniref:Uncharacterized protein n=1 Tax=Platanthera guangdongensis TaxID=2320717 RepID=A0ABR2LJ07_9ASPA